MPAKLMLRYSAEQSLGTIVGSGQTSTMAPADAKGGQRPFAATPLQLETASGSGHPAPRAALTDLRTKLPPVSRRRMTDGCQSTSRNLHHIDGCDPRAERDRPRTIEIG